jgi:ferritin-like metal-binding protein YciE
MNKQATDSVPGKGGRSASDAPGRQPWQAVEHHEIVRYGTLKTWAQELGMQDAVRLIDQNLQEEKKTDQLLTQLAEARVNRKAA